MNQLGAIMKFLIVTGRGLQGKNRPGESGVASLSFLWLALALPLLVSCASVPAPAPGEQPETPVSQAPEQAPEPKPEDYPVRPFGPEALYSLLAAEIAGYRRQYDFALERYTATARETLDPRVVERAARIAAFMSNKDAILEMVNLWLTLEPKSMGALGMAADLALNSNRLAKALEYMEAIQSLGGQPNFDAIAHRVANLKQATLDDLHTALVSLLARRPSDHKLLFSRAVILHQLGRLDESLQLLDTHLSGSSQVDVLTLKTSLLIGLNRQQEAITYLQAQLANQPDILQLRLTLARLLFEQQQLAEAREHYALALAESPNDGDIIFALALIALELKEDEQAKSYLDRMVRWGLRQGQANYYLGVIAERQDDPEAALRAYRRVANAQEFAPAQARIAALLAEAGRLPEARQHLEQARLSYPQHLWQLILIEGELLANRGLQQEALAFLDRQVALHPDNLDLLYFRAMTGHRFGDLALLERDLRTIIAIDPNNATALNALGYTLTDQTDRHEEALELVGKALALKPEDAAIIDSMGWVQYRLKNYDEALAYLRRAFALMPDHEVAAHLGEVLWVLGQREEANQVWEEALRQSPDSEILKRVMERFRGVP